ncbi:MAG: hypothetical protein SFY32_11400, partial [Bacteroidota bacterium]|nr:hypothetical protein [Bacteroidota bacterium]
QMGLLILQDNPISERLLLSRAFFLFGLLSKNNAISRKNYQLFLTTLPMFQYFKTQSLNQSINQSINQSFIHSFIQSINQSIIQSSNHSIIQNSVIQNSVIQ